MSPSWRALALVMAPAVLGAAVSTGLAVVVNLATGGRPLVVVGIGRGADRGRLRDVVMAVSAPIRHPTLAVPLVDGFGRGVRSAQRGGGMRRWPDQHRQQPDTRPTGVGAAAAA